MISGTPSVDRALGGPIGRHARAGGVWFTAGPWAYLTLTVNFLVLMLRQVPCNNGNSTFPQMCYTDITVLYYWRNLYEGKIPYLTTDIEYPVLTGGFMELGRRMVLLLGGKSQPDLSSADVASATSLYFGVTALMIFVLFAVTVWAHLKMHRPWDAMMIAASPAILTAGLINWDALVVALTALAFLAWAGKRPVWTGIWLGLGIAAKLYPGLFLIPLAVLCLRSGKLKPFFVTVGATVATWVAVNLPVYLATPSGWLNFWTFNVDRGGDLGSIWYVLSLAGIEINGVSRLEALLLVAGTLAIVALLLLAPRRPRLAQGALLILVLFLVVNKVYSPQYVLWLLPLVVMARPRWVDWAVFGFAEAAYYVAVWAHLDGILNSGTPQDRIYWLAVFFRVGVQLWIAGRVVRDIFHPELDVVRANGADDPDGGILDRAPDAPWMGRLLQGVHAR